MAAAAIAERRERGGWYGRGREGGGEAATAVSAQGNGRAARLAGSGRRRGPCAECCSVRGAASERIRRQGGLAGCSVEARARPAASARVAEAAAVAGLGDATASREKGDGEWGRVVGWAGKGGEG